MYDILFPDSCMGNWDEPGISKEASRSIWSNIQKEFIKCIIFRTYYQVTFLFECSVICIIVIQCDIYRPLQNGTKEESSKKDEKPPRPRIPGQARPVGMDRSLPDGLVIRAKIDNVRYHFGRGIGKDCS